MIQLRIRTVVAVVVAFVLGAALILVMSRDRRPADAATLPTPRAFARVISNGTFDAARSRNVASITKIGTGFYCIKVKVAIRNVVASGNGVSFNTVAEGGLVGGTLDSGVTCPTGSNAYVVTFNASTGALQDRPFYVLFI
jgi:hypothetical protein